MKKLKLKLDGIKEMLSREQMKKISGGYTNPCPEYIYFYCHMEDDCKDMGSYDVCEGDYEAECPGSASTIPCGS